eukprot:6214634-Pleurochrysis_carterae.AAC.7
MRLNYSAFLASVSSKDTHLPPEINNLPPRIYRERDFLAPPLGGRLQNPPRSIHKRAAQMFASAPCATLLGPFWRSHLWMTI